MAKNEVWAGVKPAEMQNQNGKSGRWDEMGTVGLTAWSGWINEAYNRELYWPTVAPLYNRMFRSDPEITVARVILDALSSQLHVEASMHPEVEKPTDDDKRAVDFANQVLDDVEGGFDQWLNACMVRVPFYGFGWWEAPPGLRQRGWVPPNEDPWRSEYDDGLIGYRSLAFRAYSSFYSWDMNDNSGRVRGLIQQDPPNEVVTIPLSRSLHVTFGDQDNPEGLATMEAMWRLERYKYGLEVIQGIGFEHAAGHAKFTASEELTADDKQHIAEAAKALLSAQEGNYLALPDKIDADIIDVPFQAAASILSTVRYYGILKLALLNMQWVAMSALSEHGSYSSIQDASQVFLTVLNAMARGFVKQADDQIGRRLFDYPANREAFPNMTRRPVYTVNRVSKFVDLAELGNFIKALKVARIALGDDDILAVRRKSDFLPEVLPEQGEEPEEPVEDGDGDDEDEAEDGMDSEGAPEVESTNGKVKAGDVREAMAGFLEFAKENKPETYKLIMSGLAED